MQRTVIIIFMVLLLLPFMGMLVGPVRKISRMENRTLAKFPKPEFTVRFTHRFASWFDDHFGFREMLLGTVRTVKQTVFQTSPNPEYVVAGKEGWLLYNNSRGQDSVFQSYTHGNLLSPAELDDYVAALEEKKKACNDKGITYIFAFFPQTHTIYPDVLPRRMRIQIRGTVSRADQLLQRLKNTQSTVRMIDVRAALFAAKKEFQLYRKLDTHWNACGAFTAYRDFFNQSNDLLHVNPLPRTSFTISWSENRTGDLLKAMGANDGYSETIPLFTPKPEVAAYEALSPDTAFGVYRTRCLTCPDNRTVLIFRDSYTNALYPFISPMFRNVVYVWAAYNTKDIERYKPDIVLEFRVERYL